MSRRAAARPNLILFLLFARVRITFRRVCFQRFDFFLCSPVGPICKKLEAAPLKLVFAAATKEAFLLLRFRSTIR
jgi:hypothetical protein